MTITLNPTECQDLYDFILNNRKTGLPEIKKVKEAILSGEQLEEVYNIVADNRAKSRGTNLYLETTENGDVAKIEYEAVKIPPKPIITPRIAQCECGRQYENELDKCPKCGKGNPRLYP